ncbi:hypothetical protein EV699_10162 [Plasticicumulans lactativorans]|uniref:Protein nucleotidyltransferase YdiU n=1 Tax=Plasticicumulans lactativorans TaxID=1133106 RepID=A0A4R2LA27_9GAMM|nr:YdiU family protein [Plasticicumulans lactativorans]TCO83678.1 hypothetical protein EV699_10162 [Plasticicumulans lactativorans]
MRTLDDLAFDNTYARLPDAYFSRVAPQPHGRPTLLHVNPAACALLDLDPAEAARDDFALRFSGHAPLPGAEPIATVYAGHQFGVYVPQLGDGRALLLGEVVNARGERWEMQLKGAGLTPYSRMGDGRAVLRSTIREYLCSEAMHGLGIPTTRALCLVGTDGPVYRETVETAAVLTRLAPSHVRFGHFEFFSYTGRPEHAARLADHVIAQHFPALAGLPEAERRAAWYAEVVRRTARLIAQWQAVGFAHGVMNTDNMSILGLTLDYGPFGFLDAYRPGFICNHSDDAGRYAFDQQPRVGWWNLAALANALAPIIADHDALRAALDDYAPAYLAHRQALLAAKLGLAETRDGDEELVEDWLALLARFGLDYTNGFRALCELALDAERHALRDHVPDREAFDAWAARYTARLRAEGSVDAERQARMRRTNPKYVLRNYLAQTAIERAQAGDLGEVDRLLRVLQAPFDEHPDGAAYAAEPPDWGRHIAVSCSS